jgi:hypothetical protein
VETVTVSSSLRPTLSGAGSIIVACETSARGGQQKISQHGGGLGVVLLVGGGGDDGGGDGGGGFVAVGRGVVVGRPVVAGGSTLGDVPGTPTGGLAGRLVGSTWVDDSVEIVSTVVAAAPVLGGPAPLPAPSGPFVGNATPLASAPASLEVRSGTWMVPVCSIRWALWLTDEPEWTSTAAAPQPSTTAIITAITRHRDLDDGGRCWLQP